MIKTRFAPSPTGYLHIGGIRTAIFNYAFAKKNNGNFFLRIEDTDVERSTQEAVDQILEGMSWLNLKHDGDVIYQAQNFDRHKAIIAQLLDQGHAYECYASKEELEKMRQDCEMNGIKPKYDGTWRPEEGKKLPTLPEGVTPVIRFKNPVDGNVTWEDQVKGQITVSNEELDDLILQRSDGSPTYNLSVVVDDADMGITHVIRGDDHINNTPRQINIYKACGFDVPLFAHLSMIHGEDGQKLSKRHGAASVTEYRELGFLPEAVNNYLARLGWSHGDAEIFSLDELCQLFSLKSITSSPSQFDIKKLQWLNNHYLKQKTFDEIEALLDPQFMLRFSNRKQLLSIFDLFKDRCHSLREFEANAETVLTKPENISHDLLEKYISDNSIKHLQNLSNLFNTSEFTSESIETILKAYVKSEQIKFPEVAMPLRVVLLGTDQSPSIGQIIAIIGKDNFNSRLSEQI
jgi:glutamyl-tRNA synthetase